MKLLSLIALVATASALHVEDREGNADSVVGLGLVALLTQFIHV